MEVWGDHLPFFPVSADPSIDVDPLLTYGKTRRVFPAFFCPGDLKAEGFDVFPQIAF
jgi:hypothetical protein